jgi:hypothetical protein
MGKGGLEPNFSYIDIYNHFRVQTTDSAFDVIAAGFGVHETAALTHHALPDAASVIWIVVYRDRRVSRPVIRSGRMILGKSRLYIGIPEQGSENAHLLLGKRHRDPFPPSAQGKPACAFASDCR